MRAADLPFGTIIADGPRVMVKLRDTQPWHEAMTDSRARSNDEADWCLANGYTVVRYGLEADS